MHNVMIIRLIKTKNEKLTSTQKIHMYADIKALLKTPRKKVLIAIMWKNNKFNTRGGDTIQKSQNASTMDTLQLCLPLEVVLGVLKAALWVLHKAPKHSFQEETLKQI